MNEPPPPDKGAIPDPAKAILSPPAPVSLTTARAARLIEAALTTPDGIPGDWKVLLDKAPSVEQLSQWVPEYDVRQRVARGSSGWVYVARHRLLDRQVALKVLAPAADGREEETARQRASEGRLIAQLSHPNVLRVYDSRPLPGGQHLFVFQYADGGSLRQRLTEGPLQRVEALTLAAGMAAGLAHAHAAGIIHRDLKPENILFNETGTPMMGDFGSAVRPEPGDAAALACGTTGTPHYRAPEQIAGGPLGPAVDLYAFGIILHEMLAGTIPEGTGSVVAPILDPALPADLRSLLSGLLHPDPERRTPDAAGLAQQLRRKGPSALRRREVLFPAAAAILALAVGFGYWFKRSPPLSPALASPPPVPPLPGPEGRTAALQALTTLRQSEERGAWEAGNALYAPMVEYFSDGQQSRDAVVAQRMKFASEYLSFKTLLLEPLDLPRSGAPQVRVQGLYWCAAPKRAGGASLGTIKDDLVFQPASPGGGSWQIASHQHSEPPNLWPCTAGRTLDEVAATAWLDSFLAGEASGDRETQLRSYGPRVRYYGLGWISPRLIRQSLEDRQRHRPDFRCERRGIVKVIEGSHMRWRLEVPCQSFPVLKEVPGSDQVRIRTFILAPKGEAEWLVIAESTPLSGQAALDSFWQQAAAR